MQRGKFIVIDGPDGAGKTLQCNMLRAHFKEERFLFTREPGGTPLAEAIRGLVLGEEAEAASSETRLSLVWAARHDHLRKKIVPALLEGKHVITDRFDSSTFAFQLYGEQALYLEPVFELLRSVYLRENLPDKYIFLDIGVEEGLRRIGEKHGTLTYFDTREAAFHNRVKQGYERFAEKYNAVIIDASRTPQQVNADLISKINALIQS